MTAPPPLLLFGFLWLGYVVLLIAVPSIFPPDPTLPNVAARSGYNTGLAYTVIAAWSVLGMLFFALASERRWLGRFADSVPPAGAGGSGAASPLRQWSACLVTGALIALLYWPPFLTRYGPYVEDKYFMNVLARMQCGQLPYRDFEFLYGPLMIYPAHYWMNLFGYSMQSYFSLLALLQGSFFAIILRAFQHHLGSARERLFAFAVFAPFVFDTLLGLNYIGWRILPAILAIMIVAARPHTLRTALLAGVLIGIQLAYSYEYGIVSLIAISMMYATSFFGGHKPNAFFSALLFFITACLIGYAVSRGLTGDSFRDYIGATVHALRHASDTGTGNFRFYWTLNSLSLFGLLGIAVMAVGAGLWKMFRNPLSYGDRLLFGSLLFALGTLRIAIQRADIWHITIPFVALLIVFLWRPQLNVFSFNHSMQRLAWGFIGVAALTRSIGIFPMAHYFGSGLLQGAQDLIQGKQPPGQIISRAYSIESELSHPDPDIAALAGYLAEPVRSGRPVVFYQNRWWMANRAGVCPSGYAFYQLMYTDGYRPLKSFFEQNKGTIVVMKAAIYDRLFNNGHQKKSPAILPREQKIASWLSSIHYDQKSPEREIKYEIWKRNLGLYLVKHYRRTMQFGQEVVLERREPGLGNPVSPPK
jgi:hypothetical protein